MSRVKIFKFGMSPLRINLVWKYIEMSSGVAKSAQGVHKLKAGDVKNVTVLRIRYNAVEKYSFTGKRPPGRGRGVDQFHITSGK